MVLLCWVWMSDLYRWSAYSRGQVRFLTLITTCIYSKMMDPNTTHLPNTKRYQAVAAFGQSYCLMDLQ